MSKKKGKEKESLTEPLPQRDVIKRHLYDIDVFEILDEFRKRIISSDDEKMIRGLRKFDFIEANEKEFITEMGGRGLDLTNQKMIRHYILPSSYNLYHLYLGWKLLIVDVYKIEAVLTYQSVLFLGNYYAEKDNFAGLVEFMVYDVVKQNLFNSEGIRLEKIMSWVERNRNLHFDNEKLESRKNKKNGKKVPPKNPMSIDMAFSTILFENLVMYIPEGHRPALFKVIVKGKKAELICFEGNANVLTELFKRLRYNKKIVVSNNETLAGWISSTFCVRGSNGTLKALNRDTVLDVLKRKRNEPIKSRRILEALAPYEISGERIYKSVKKPASK